MVRDKSPTGGSGTRTNDSAEDTLKSFHHAEKTEDEPCIRVMALHALAYCERLFYLEEVEEIRMADANVYSGRRLHEEVDKGLEVYTMELASEKLGIRGKLDCVRRKDGKLVVHEHKKGKSKDGNEPWPSDRLQVLAYALLLADETGEGVEEARIHYHADNRIVTVPVKAGEAEAVVGAAVERAKAVRDSLCRPPVAVPERLCRTCSLAPVCLPEEERFALSEKPRPLRLFPPEHDRRVIHIVEQGASVRKDGEQLVVYLPDGSKRPLPHNTVEALVLHGNVQVSTQIVHFCAARDIGVQWLSYAGHFVGAFAPGAGGVQRRTRQYEALRHPAFTASLAVRVAMTKVENQLRYILRATRGKTETERTTGMQEAIARIKRELAAMAKLEMEIEALRMGEASGASSRPVSDSDKEAGTGANAVSAVVDNVRGHEGMAGKEYFRLLPSVLSLSPEDFLYFSGRNRRPPKDAFNALLSFGYALLYKDCTAALLAVGLEPAVGFYHTPRSSAYPLALDLMELFRVILWDVPLIGSVNRKQWRREDFETAADHVWLNMDGRRKAIRLYEERKQEKWKHPVLDYSLSYARTIELEARLLEKEWTGNAGLFGKLRLR